MARMLDSSLQLTSDWMTLKPRKHAQALLSTQPPQQQHDCYCPFARSALGAVVSSPSLSLLASLASRFAGCLQLFAAA